MVSPPQTKMPKFKRFNCLATQVSVKKRQNLTKFEAPNWGLLQNSKFLTIQARDMRFSE